MKQSIKDTAVIKVLLALFLIMNLSVPGSFGADTPPKMNRHDKKDVACEACHAKGASHARPDDATCMGCHGSYAELADKTAALDDIKAGITNPHKSHIGEVRCTLCHKNHTPSVLYCNECHSPKFDMTVP